MIPRMRTPAEAIREIKREDPESGITEHFIRKLARDGKIASVMAGRKLVELQYMLDRRASKSK